MKLGMAPGTYRGIDERDYLALDAIGSSRLGWLATSPLHYHHMLTQPAEESEALLRGHAVHRAVLQPDSFPWRYALEPDITKIADSARPRGTKQYREQVAALESSGRTVLKREAWDVVRGTAQAVLTNRHALHLLDKTPERELSIIWERDGLRCRGRADMLGHDVLGDLKTTRDLSSFSPWTITKYGYHRQAAWYMDGLSRLGYEIRHFFLVAVETSPPFDVGVFALDPEAIAIGKQECDRMVALMAECERAGEWPGMFPDVQRGMVTDAVVAASMETEAA